MPNDATRESCLSDGWLIFKRFLVGLKGIGPTPKLHRALINCLSRSNVFMGYPRGVVRRLIKGVGGYCRISWKLGQWGQDVCFSIFRGSIPFCRLCWENNSNERSLLPLITMVMVMWPSETCGTPIPNLLIAWPFWSREGGHSNLIHLMSTYWPIEVTHIPLLPIACPLLVPRRWKLQSHPLDEHRLTHWSYSHSASAHCMSPSGPKKVETPIASTWWTQIDALKSISSSRSCLLG